MTEELMEIWANINSHNIQDKNKEVKIGDHYLVKKKRGLICDSQNSR